MADQAAISNALATLQGTQLYKRKLNLTLGFVAGLNPDIDVSYDATASIGLDVSGLDVDFKVEKSLKPTEPSTCEIKVYNMNPVHREQISGQHNLTVRLEAGYVGGITQLYFAEARAAWTTREGPTFVTHIESSDTIARLGGAKKTKKPQPGSLTGNIYRTMGARVPLETAFREIVAQLGIGEGNLKSALANLQGQKLNAVNGSALIGNGARRMTDLCRSAGLEWSIQDGSLQLLNIAGVLSDTKAIEISADTGMLDSPAVDSQGTVSVTTLMIPGLTPGVLVNLNSLFIKGGHRVERCRYVGSTKGNEWHVAFDAVRY